ncbi:MAG TPA: glycine betaine ABC transporter substrate-binding protein, partial [Bryobacteraceae bacterium]|nr:glycine betaine ABC transporter substrate-binding protein [Bryobacteraceae bacterium]
MDRTTTCTLIAAWFMLTGCSTDRPGRIVVGAKNFTEQALLGEIIAQQIERSLGVTVERQLTLGGTLLAHEALRAGNIDLYPEYTGTALTAILQQPVQKDAAAVLGRVRSGYAQWGLQWMEPLGFNNTFAMVVRAEDAEKDQLRTMSDAAKRTRPWQLGVGFEFVGRPDGLRGLVAAYDLRLQGSPATMDLGLLYPALEARRIEMGAANATDGALAGTAFRVLEDDRGYFPPYQCAIVVRHQALERHPGLQKALAALHNKIDDSTMRKLNSAVDREHRRAA